MNTFASMYNRLMSAGLNDELDKEVKDIKNDIDFDPHQLDCLLNPKEYSPVIRLGDCTCSKEEMEKCHNSCEFDAVEFSEHGVEKILYDKCVGCGECIEKCVKNNLAELKEFVPIIKLLKEKSTPVYAMIAPAYISQFSEDTTPGSLRTAFKQLGFAGMIEVALFADILTLKEALEFDKSIKNDDDFMLTSCCCPMWIAMIKKVYNDLVPHLPPSVSPMAACGRAIKILYPNAKTVFIGPCIAKKAEARADDIKDDVDFVLTFQEMKDVFKAASIEPEGLPEDLRDHSSKAGRTYARTAGVSQAVQDTLNRIRPDKEISFKAEYADGVADCKVMLNKLINGELKANFIEGMGCKGGCVGGPKSLVDVDKATKHVNEYGESAKYQTPADNPYVIELLKRLGFDTIEQLLEEDNIFIRDFGK